MLFVAVGERAGGARGGGMMAGSEGGQAPQTESPL